MSDFTDKELDYLTEREPGRLARIATVGKNGMPHVVPVGWRFNRELDTIDIRGMNLAGTKKFRDVRRDGRAAVVIDDLLSTDPWQPRGVEVRGPAEALDGERPLIRIHPGRIVSWGLENQDVTQRHARTVVQRLK
jgi:pyridoxamine 5'-phosphate oxidase family protein